MKLELTEAKGIKFYHRVGFSDYKAFNEVVINDSYQKRGTKILNGETWIDAGGNVGAFTLLACSLGAKVKVFEPDPFNCQMIEKNLKLNNFDADIVQAALVHDDTKKINLYVGNNNNVWRNSIVKNWCGKGIKVPCVNFDEETKNYDNCKIDIEGAEMPILENTNRVFNKLVYEWSFDIDPSLERLWKVIDKQKKHYELKTAWSTICYESKKELYWQQSWFPACVNVHGFKNA
tara:strand:- start:730 stop:1428 length:699 start_codon:yes stop_codon:yes gene_type:complete